MASLTKESGKTGKEKAWVNKFGLTDHDTLENGGTTKQMEKEFYIMQMEMYTMENGSTTKQVDMGHTLIPTERVMLASGFRTSKTDSGGKCGPMAKCTRVSTRTAAKMGKDF